MNRKSSINFYPNEIVDNLNRYIVGQEDAKKTIAIALRNRYRASMIKDSSIKDSVKNHNIMLIGPTGVGKTEIVLTVSKMQNTPFIKVEATKFTEIGYIGRDVESIIRDLVEIAVANKRSNVLGSNKKPSKDKMEEAVLNAVLNELYPNGLEKKSKKEIATLRKQYLAKLQSGELNDFMIEVEPASDYATDSPAGSFDQSVGFVGIVPFSEFMKSMTGDKKKSRRVTVEEAFKEMKNGDVALFDEDSLVEEAVYEVENYGIVFIDEIDKLISNDGGSSRGEVSREGVQRDLLPLMDGSTVQTKYGHIKTHKILFVASGAFHTAKVSDMMPELQGRFPIKATLKALSEEDFVKILTVPENNIIKQYKALLAVDRVSLVFSDDAITEIAKTAMQLNSLFDNIGARRLHGLMDKILQDVSFNATRSSPKIDYNVTKEYVQKQAKDLFKNSIKKDNFVI